MGIELGILGAGNMAEAIARGIIRAGLLAPDQMQAADISPQRREVFWQELRIETSQDGREIAKTARILLLSVKPQHMGDLLSQIAPVVASQTLFVSIAAGISTRFIESRLGEGKCWRVIRTMPNTPMLVGEGMVALSRGQYADDLDAAQARRLFEASAKVIDVPESQLDAVTAISGSGPAYVFYLVEQMIRAGTELGLSADHARQLAIQTAIGAAKMLGETSEDPQELRRKVTSPGGTTQAAISHLEKHQVAEHIIEAIKAAARRSAELGK